MRIGRGRARKGHRKKLRASDLDFTSLLDVSTILLVFLIQSYDSSQHQINVNNEISLPPSKSLSMNHQGVLVQVSESKIWVDRVLIFDTANMPANFIDDQGRRVVPLYDELVKKREGFSMIGKSVPNAKPFSGLINLVVDKSIKYSYLKKLMYTAAQAGFKEYKFVVRGQE